MKIVGIIPARMASSRYPGKPLVPILGRPMLEHVYLRTCMSSTVDEVFVATCDDEIRVAVKRFGGTCIMTSPEHQRASDRVAEAASELDVDVVVLIQGDEPMVQPDMIDAAVEGLLQAADAACVNLGGAIRDDQELQDVNTVKVVVDREGNALYFSRHPIGRSLGGRFSDLSVRRQVCIIPFRVELLATYAALPATPLEVAESIDMLRLLEHGYRVRIVDVDDRTYPVDVSRDRDRVEKMMEHDPLLHRYESVSLKRA